MNSLVNNIKNFFSSAPANDGCELQSLKRQEKNTKGLNASEPRAQHSASTKSFLTSFFNRVSFSLPSFLCGSRARTSFSSKVSKTLDKLAAAQESNNSKQMIASLRELQEMKCVDANGLDDALKTHLLIKSKHRGKHNSVQVVKQMLSLSEANPVKFQAPGHLESDERLNQFHADLMKRLEEQYGEAFTDK
jgi:hypothetical protein